MRLALWFGTPIAVLLAMLLLIGAAPLPGLTVSRCQGCMSPVTGSDAAIEAEMREAPSPAGLAWVRDGKVLSQWVSSDRQLPMASITKVITVLTALDAQPVEPGTPGKTYTVTQKDRDMLAAIWAQNGSWAKVNVGQKLSTRQLLELILIQSANNYAKSYANWVFGDNAHFVQAANVWLKAHGLTHTKVFEPSGLDEHNVSTVGDLIKLGALAMNNPVVAQVVGEAQADITDIGTIKNHNTLVGRKDVVGVKTGSLDVVGRNIVAAARYTSAGREHTVIAVVLGAKTVALRRERTSELIAAAKATTAPQTVLAAHARVGSLRTWQGERVDLVTANARPVLRSLRPGEKVKRTLSLDNVVVRPEKGAGEVRLRGKGGSRDVPVLSAKAIAEPDLLWRIQHPLAVLGWQARAEVTDEQPG